MAAINMFYVPVRDSDGDMVPNVSVETFLAFDGTTPSTAATLVDKDGNPYGTNGVFQTDADGDQYVYVADANIQTLYFRVQGQSVVTPVHCANQPDFSQFSERTTDPGDSALVLVEISGTQYKMTFDNLAKLLVDKIIAKTNGLTRKGFVVANNDVNPTHAMLLTVSTQTAGTGYTEENGDVHLRVS